MAWDVKKALFFLSGLAALFWWSIWAGLAGVGLILLWLVWLFAGDVLKVRELKRQCRARIEEELAVQGLEAESIFCSYFGAGALGISRAGRKVVYTAPVSLETTVYDSDAAFEAHARKLPQGDFELAITVPGRVTKKPREHAVLVKQRSEAERWTKALGPLLGEKVKSDL